jgi:hypothetical protein
MITKYLEAENKQDLIGDNFIGLVDYFLVLDLEKIFAPVDPNSNFCIFSQS